jgi:hypothetical protein
MAIVVLSEKLFWKSSNGAFQQIFEYINKNLSDGYLKEKVTFSLEGYYFLDFEHVAFLDDIENLIFWVDAWLNEPVHESVRSNPEHRSSYRMFRGHIWKLRNKLEARRKSLYYKRDSS